MNDDYVINFIFCKGTLKSSELKVCQCEFLKNGIKKEEKLGNTGSRKDR